MEGFDTFSAEGVRRLYDVMQRVNSSSDLAEVLHEVAHGVVEGLGYGIAAISVLEGETLVMTAVAGPPEVREAILGRRTPADQVLSEFAQADHWGILRFVPHQRLDPEHTPYAWLPDFEPSDDPDAWHPMDALYAPLYDGHGRLLGNMSVDMPPGGRIPSRQQRELLEMYVVQAGLALANAQQRRALEEQVRLGETLRGVVTAGTRQDLDEVLANAALVLQEGLLAHQVTVRCFPDTTDPGRERAAGHPRPARSGERMVDLRLDLAEHLSRAEVRPLSLNDDDEDGDWDAMPRTGETLRAIMRERGWTWLLVAPVNVGSDLLGYLVVMRSSEQTAFTPAEVDAVLEVSRELGRLVRDARVREQEKRLLSELQELDRYKGELIATISHELKTPLTSIIGHTEMLEDLGERAVPSRSIDAIRRNADRLDRLITDLLGYSRTQDRRAIEHAPIDLAEVAQGSLELLAVQARSGGVELTLVPPERPVVVQADPEELPRVVDNILSNAVKYTRPGGRVDVSVREADGYGEVVVTDTGLGISTGDQAHLFSAFHRSTNPDALTIPGTGLGLAIARRIAELHGGEVTVDSELGRGSTFTVRIPVTPP